MGGTCVRTETSFYCRCTSSFTGTYCRTFVYGRLYPYGDYQLDNKLNPSDDGVSNTRISISQGFLFKCQIYRYIYVMMNGYITFEQRFFSSIAAKFPLTTDKQNLAVIAPLWADIDSTNSANKSTVYYHVYECVGKGIGCKTRAQNLSTRATQDIRAYTGNVNFKATLIVVITWSNVYLHSKSVTETSTFQLVLISDHLTYTSYALFIYDRVGWTRPFLVQVGFATPAPLGIGEPFVFNHLASGRDYVAIALAHLVGNTQKKGTWIYRMGDKKCEILRSSEYLCRSWHSTQLQYAYKFNLLRNKYLTKCPCMFWQVELDPRYIINWAERCSYTASPEQNGGLTQMCCYDKNGILLTRHDLNSGSLLFFHPLRDSSRYLKHDKLPKEHCCRFSENCDLFYSVRPLDTCKDYKTFSIGCVFGEPHIETLDGYKYTYNGIGEYWLIRGNDISLQGRTVRAWDKLGNNVNASIFGAFAMKDKSSPSVTVELSQDRNSMIILQKGDTYNLTDWFYSGKIVPEEKFYLNTTFRRMKNNALYIALETGVSMRITVLAHQLQITTIALQSLRNQSTRGLLGPFNGYQDDDLTLPDGSTSIPLNSSVEHIHYQFAEHWRINQTDSLFTYPNNLVVRENYQVISFRPIFSIDELNLTATEKSKMDAICKFNTMCMMDYAITKDELLANYTLYTDTTNDQLKEKLENRVPYITGVINIDIEVHVAYSTEFIGADPDGDLVVVSMVNGPTEASYDSLTGMFTWNVTTMDPVYDLNFRTNDSYITITHEVTVRLCNCTYGRGQCNYAVPIVGYNKTDSFQVVSCECQPPYDGAHCELLSNGCSDNPCLNSTYCSNLSEAEQLLYNRRYNCSRCPDGYDLQDDHKCIDIDECTTGTSLCQQQCVNTQGGYECTCLTGYTSFNDTHCTDIDECALRQDNCDQLCQNTDAGYTCTCYPGYTLTPIPASTDNSSRCELTDLGVKAVCLTTPPRCPQLCVGSPSGAACMCWPGYAKNSAGVCQDIDECLTNPCVGGACINTAGKYMCTCAAGFSLDTSTQKCQACQDGFWGDNCEGICSCLTDADCNVVTGCSACVGALTGANCTEDVDECSADPNLCGTGNTCVNVYNGYSCDCQKGTLYTKNQCIDIDECQKDPCKNGATCNNLLAKYTCTCALGWTGQTCNSDINECLISADKCMKNSTCVDLKNDFSCACIDSTYGIFCQYTLEKMIAATTTPEPTTETTTILIAADKVRPTKELILIVVFGSIAGILALVATVYCCAWFVCCRRKKNTADSYTEHTSTLDSTDSMYRRRFAGLSPTSALHWYSNRDTYLPNMYDNEDERARAQQISTAVTDTRDLGRQSIDFGGTSSVRDPADFSMLRNFSDRVSFPTSRAGVFTPTRSREDTQDNYFTWRTSE